MGNPKPIRFILERTLEALEIDVSLKTYSIFAAWKDIVGESVALHTQPRTVRNRILFIDVSHPTWTQQLHFVKPTLLEKINTFLGEPHILDIRFKLGKISPSIPIPSKAQIRQGEDLDEKTLNRIESLLKKISDEEVRRGLQEVLIRGAKLERSRKKLR